MFRVTKYVAVANALQWNPPSRFAANSSANVKPQSIAKSSWDNARPYSELPGPSKWELFKFFRPGGTLSDKPFVEVQKEFQTRYGNICKLPGIMGKADNVIVYEPDDIEKVFRNEGAYPIREGFDSVVYYRKIHRKDVFKDTAGVGVEQGEAWWDFRHKVNPVMMMLKTTKVYVPRIDEISVDFLKKLESVKGTDNSAPEDFLTYLKKWSLESVACISLDVRIGLLEEKENPVALKYFDNINSFFIHSYQLDILPSIWKLYKTPTFKASMKNMDELTDAALMFMEQGKQALEKLKKSPEYSNPDRVKGVLERLLEIDENVALIMAMESITAGVDTTSTSTFNLLYNLALNPDKQEILRKEILTILPEKITPLTADKMVQMPYLRACMKESSRYSPIFGNLRSSGTDMVLQGFKIPKGTIISMANELLVACGEQYEQADKFIPERFLRNKEEANGCPAGKGKEAHPFVNLPFGFGPRMCIGRRFAELEMEALVSRLIRSYKIGWKGPPPQYSTMFGKMPTGKTHFYFEDVEE